MSKQATTKKCKYCKSEIDAGAKICPVCKKKQKTHGCLIALLVLVGFTLLLLIIGALASDSSDPVENDPQISQQEATPTYTPEASAQPTVPAETPQPSAVIEDTGSLIIDATQFSRISVDELYSIMGEPDSVEDWMNTTSRGAFPMQRHLYNNTGEPVYEFITYQDVVVKLNLYSEMYYNNTGELFTYDPDNVQSILSDYNIQPAADFKEVVNNGFTAKYSPVSENVAAVEIFDMNEADKTYGCIYFTYNLNYFDL